MQTVDVFVRVHGEERRGLVKLRGKGDLDEISVDGWVFVELANRGVELFLGGVLREVRVDRRDADLGAILVLHRYVPTTRPIVTDEDRPEPRRDALRRQLLDSGSDLAADLLRHPFAIENDRRHRCLSRA
jgi:hypothetical protein